MLTTRRAVANLQAQRHRWNINAVAARENGCVAAAGTVRMRAGRPGVMAELGVYSRAFYPSPACRGWLQWPAVSSRLRVVAGGCQGRQMGGGSVPAALVLAGILAAPVCTAALLIRSGHPAPTTRAWPTTRPVSPAVVGTAVPAARVADVAPLV